LDWCCTEATLGPQLPNPGWEALYKPTPAQEEAAGGGLAGKTLAFTLQASRMRPSGSDKALSPWV